MRFHCGPSTEQKAQRSAARKAAANRRIIREIRNRLNWRPKFAWFPITVGIDQTDGRKSCVWLTRVYRRQIINDCSETERKTLIENIVKETEQELDEFHTFSDLYPDSLRDFLFEMEARYYLQRPKPEDTISGKVRSVPEGIHTLLVIFECHYGMTILWEYRS